MTTTFTNIKNELPTIETYAANLCDYNDGYICDIIAEIADNNTSIYHCDIFDFIRENPEAVEDAIQEFGWDGCGGTLERAAQMGEYLTIEQEIYNDLEDALYLYALNFVLYDLDIDYLPADLVELIEDTARAYNNNDRLDALRDEITELLADRDIIDEDGNITDAFIRELDRADEAGELN